MGGGGDLQSAAIVGPSGPPDPTRPAVPLTADLFARAIIAAARVYGDDPVRAFTSSAKWHRRCLTAACGGIAWATGAPVKPLAAILGVRPSGVFTARSNAPPGGPFARAEEAARDAALDRLAAGVELPPPAAGLHKPRVLTARAARREVMDALRRGPMTGPELMEALGLGEGQVRAALADLSEEREVSHDPLTAEGWRAQFWRAAA